MENFEFKSQVATSIRQSKRLLELGLKRETADMKYIPYSRCAVPKYLDDGFGFKDTEYILAWSLHRLLLLLNCAYVELDANNPFEDCITRIEFMIKESKTFNKDYLEEK